MKGARSDGFWMYPKVEPIEFAGRLVQVQERAGVGRAPEIQPERPEG